MRPLILRAASSLVRCRRPLCDHLSPDEIVEAVKKVVIAARHKDAAAWLALLSKGFAAAMAAANSNPLKLPPVLITYIVEKGFSAAAILELKGLMGWAERLNKSHLQGLQELLTPRERARTQTRYFTRLS